MNSPFVGGLSDAHDGRGLGIAQAAWPAQNLPCDLPDDLAPDDADDDLEDRMMDLAMPLAVVVASALGLLVLAVGHLAGRW